MKNFQHIHKMKLLLAGLLLLFAICIPDIVANPLNREKRTPQYGYSATTSATYFGLGSPYYNRGWGSRYHGHHGQMRPGSTTVIKKTVIVNRP